MAKNRDHSQNLAAPASYDRDDAPDDLENQQETNSVECVNISARVVRFEIAGTRYALKPGQSVFLHKSYALARKMAANRDAIPSVVELQTSKMVLPITDKRVIEAGHGGGRAATPNPEYGA